MKPPNEPLMVVVLLCAATVLLVIGATLGRAYERHKAIAAGVGRWTINPTTSVTGFVYDRP